KAFAEFIENFLFLFFGDGDWVNGNFQAFIVWQFNGWANIKFGVEIQGRFVVAFVAWYRSDIDFWTSQWRKFVVAQCFLEERIEVVVDGVFDNEAAADALVDQTCWNFALTEARDLNLVCKCF